MFSRRGRVAEIADFRMSETTVHLALTISTQLISLLKKMAAFSKGENNLV